MTPYSHVLLYSINKWLLKVHKIWAHLKILWSLGWHWPTWPVTLTNVIFSHDSCDLWSWPVWPLTSNITSKTVKRDLKRCFWDLAPWPLTYGPDLRGRPWGHPQPWPDQNSQTRPEIMFLGPGVLTFDLWSWPSGSTLGSSTAMPWPKRSNETWNHVFVTWRFDLWPMVLTFGVDLGVIHSHALTKFGDHRSNSFRDMN